MNDWSIVLLDLDTCIDLCLYISSHLIYVKKLFKHQSLKRERVEKALLRKLVRLGKGGAKMYSNCMIPKTKAYFPKKLKKKKKLWHRCSILSCIDQSMKNGSQMKSFQSM